MSDRQQELQEVVDRHRLQLERVLASMKVSEVRELLREMEAEMREPPPLKLVK